MGTVKYSGPVASFHCPTEATIRSLKVHFSPKQEGSGDPSPENVRPIVGWEGVVVHNDDGNIVPEEYQKVEYLESTGTQWFWTDVNVQDGLTVESTSTYSSGQDSYLFGGAASSKNDRLCFNGVYSGNLQCAYPSVWFYAGTIVQDNTTIYKVITTFINNTAVISINGVTTFNNSRPGELPINTGEKCVCFGARSSAGVANYFYKGKVYKLSVKKNLETLANFIPCRRKSDDKPGMYDTVTQTFFTNQGTGEFICGPDVGQTISVTFPAKSSNLFDKTATMITSWSNIDQNEICYCTANLAGSNVDGPMYFSANCRTLGLPISVNDNVKIYFFNGLPSTTRYTWAICDNSGKLLEKHAYIVNSSTSYANFTASYDGYMFIEWCLYDDAATDGVVITKNELYEVTQYEAYNPDNTVYGGWVDLITGEVQEEWIKRSGNDLNVSMSSSTAEPWVHRISVRGKWISNIGYENAGGAFEWLSDKIKHGNAFVNGEGLSGAGVLYVYDDTINDASEFIEKYSDTEFAYQLREETYKTYSLAPTQLQTFLGQNNVWSNADYVEVEYDLHETQTILARKQFIIANQPHIESASGTIASFKTDLRAPLKSTKFEFLPKTNIGNFPTYWAPGEGKNLFHVTATSTSINGVDFTVCSDGTIEANGTANADVEFDLGTVTLNEGTYRINGGIRMNYASIKIRNKNTQCASTDAILTIDSTSETITPYIYIKNGYTIDRKFYPMIRDSSNTNGIFAPYSYVFPISGMNEIDINIANSNIGFMNNYRLGTSISWGTVRASYGDFTNDVTSACFVFPIKPGTYRVSCKNSDTYWVSRGIALEMKSLQFNEGTTGAFKGFEHWAWYTNKTSRLTSKIITIPAEADGLLIQVKMLEDNITMTSELLSGLQFTCSPGTSDINFISSTLSTIPISWQSTAGIIYGGYVDLVTGEVWKTWDIIDLGTCTWIQYNNNSSIFYTRNLNNLKEQSNQYTVLCTAYPYEQQKNVTAMNDKTINDSEQLNRGNVAIRDINYANSTSADFKEAMNGVICAYKLATPILVTTLTTQALKTLRGTNNIWSNSNGDITVQFWKH